MNNMPATATIPTATTQGGWMTIEMLKSCSRMKNESNMPKANTETLRKDHDSGSNDDNRKNNNLADCPRRNALVTPWSHLARQPPFNGATKLNLFFLAAVGPIVHQSNWPWCSSP